MFPFGKGKSSLFEGLAFIAVALVGVFFSILKDPEPTPIPKEDAILNETLTNEVCRDSLLFPLDSAVASLMKRYHIHGVSLAIMRNDSLLYAQGYGEADKDVPMETRTLLRVASVSKLITAVGIMKLCEMNSISLDQGVFGNGDILEDLLPKRHDRRMEKITIRQLLTHSAGFTCRMGFDPMFSTENLMRSYKLKNAPKRDDLAKICLRFRLAFNPGTSSEYSNLGYLLLSLIIERVTGEDYEKWMSENILEPSGCHEFHLAKNGYSKRYSHETRYYLPEESTTDYEALLGSGGWICSAPELLRFVASIDGLSEVPDIISMESISTMTEPTDSLTYGIGWVDISEEGVWTRTGTLSGTNAIIQRFPDGECWTIITNTDSPYKGRFNRRLSRFIKKSREDFSPLLPCRDLFHV